MVTDGARAQVRPGRPVLLDAAAALAFLLLELTAALPVIRDRAPSATEATLLVFTFAAVALRSRRPVPALALTTAGAACVLVLQGDVTLVVIAPLLALYSAAVRSDRRTTVLAWAVTAAVLPLTGALGAPEFTLETLPLLPWTAVVAAVGDGVRNRRAYLAAVEERAVRAERSREQEARRRVAEERVRIARELHDVVAHHIAVVSVQAGVAQHLLTTQPAAAVEALAHVRRSAGAVLEELGDILSVLREPGEPASSAPAPGLARLDALVDSFAAAGLEVEWSLRGTPRALPATVDLVAYRVLEEALTNALKHGTGTARLSIEHQPSSVALRVLNDVPALVSAGSRPPPAHHRPHTSAGTGTGHGLIGMRERASAVGGTLTAEPVPGSGFCVIAELPVRSAAS